MAWVYAPVISADYIWDDNDYVSANRNLDTLDGLGRIWFAPRSSPQYYPMVFTSFWLERQAFGPGPTSHRAVNVCLHALNALLLWVVLRRLDVPGASVVALVFAVHPVHLESVAWISERKNVLSGTFYLASLLAYLRFAWPGQTQSADRAGSSAGPRWGWYAASFLLFTCALLSKTVTATLPGVVLLVLWWKRGRLAIGDVTRLSPFLVLGALAGWGTAWLEMEHVAAAREAWTLGPAERILLAGRVPWFYAQKLLWPVPLIFIYPRWEMSLTVAQTLYPLATMAILVGLYGLRRRLGKGPFVAVAFFLLTLFPAMGFVHVYPMRYSYVADHFQYLASIGVIALVVGVGGWLFSKAGWPRAGVALAAGAIVALSVTARAETRKYEGIEALWLDTIAKNPGAWMAHNNLGTLALRQQRWNDAEGHFKTALRLKPDLPEANNNLGTALYSQGKIDEAIEQYRAAVAVDAANAGAWNNLGIAFAAAQRYPEAVHAYRSALAVTPGNAMAQYNLGNAFFRMNEFAPATAHYREAVRLDPSLAMAHYNLGVILLTQRSNEAAGHLRRAFELAPGFAAGHFHVANIQLQLGLYLDAIESYSAVIALDPRHVDAFCNRGTVHVQLGRLAEAARDYGEALRLSPGYPAAEAGLRRMRARAR